MNARAFAILGAAALAFAGAALAANAHSGQGAARGASAAPTVAVLVPSRPIDPLQPITAGTPLAPVVVAQSALSVAGPDPVPAAQRAQLNGQVPMVPLQQGRAVDWGDFYGHSSGERAALAPDQERFTLPLTPLSSPMPPLQVGDYVDVHATVDRDQDGSTMAQGGLTPGTAALSRSGLASDLVVSHARVDWAARDAVTLVVPRDAVDKLNILRSLGTYSLGQISPLAPVMTPGEVTARGYAAAAAGTAAVPLRAPTPRPTEASHAGRR